MATETGNDPISQIAPLLILTLLFLPAVALPQPSLPLFGAELDHNAGFKPSSVEAVFLPGTRTIGIAAADPASRSIRFFRIDPSGRFVLETTLATPFGVYDMQWGQGTDDQAFLIDSFQGRFAVASPPDAEGKRPIDLFPVPYERFVTADLNSDGEVDLLLFGKQTTGIGVHLGGEGTIPALWKTIVPDISVSDIATTDLNGDGIIDLFVVDWVSNRVVLYIGIGRGIFSEQIAHQLPGEPDRIAFTEDPNRGESHLAVTIPEREEIHLFSVNALGEIRPVAKLRSVMGTLGTRFADVNNDGNQDLIAAARDECVVFVADSAGSGFQRIPYGVEGDLVDWDLADFDRNGRPDLLLATNNPSKLIVIANGLGGRLSFPWPDRYVTPASPGALTIGDFNRDNLADVAIVSPGSRVCSFFMNAGRGRFDGQRVVSLANQPDAIRMVNRQVPGPPIFLISHSSSDEVTVLRPFSPGKAMRQFTIPTDRHPFVIAADVVGQPRTLSFLTRNGGRSTGGQTVSLFEQLSDDQFIETTIRPSIGRQISAITAADLTGDRIPDLVFSTPDHATRTTGLFIARGIDRTTFHPAERLFSLPDSDHVHLMLRVSDIDGDSQPDIILAVGPPENALVVLYPVIGGSAVDSVLRVPNISLLEEGHLTIADLDMDGDVDFCAVDGLARSILMIPGERKRSFGPVRSIAAWRGVTAIGVGSFRSADVRDLVIVNGTAKVISFLFDPFRR
ncbi:MAG: VCBS repeat-containing protein [Ignavibacteria bacterium]|nr:VCBS repeat-containing protein [Ignavibacteria bacterium]